MASHVEVSRAGLLLALLLVPASLQAADKPAEARSVELFQAMDEGVVDVKFIPQNDKEARILIENKTKEPLHVKLPEAFAGVPVLAQFGGGGGGLGGGGLGGGGGGGQGLGGGLGGGGGGLGGGGGQGGGGGFFNIAPEKVGKIKVACVCLDHGKPDPTPRMQYKLVPVTSYVENPAVIELLKAFGHGGLDQTATQAAIWHLNNNLSWQELAAKRSGRKTLLSGEEPYFSALQLQAAMQFSSAAKHQAAQTPAKDDSLSQK